VLKIYLYNAYVYIYIYIYIILIVREYHRHFRTTSRPRGTNTPRASSSGSSKSDLQDYLLSHSLIDSSYTVCSDTVRAAGESSSAAGSTGSW